MINVPREFVSESWRIEGIGTIVEADVTAHNNILNLPSLRVADIENFVLNICGKSLRDKVGMNVRIGEHFPPKGGPEIRNYLEDHIRHVNNGQDPFSSHVEYETLHPFMDGNGRSGRVIWAWQMIKDGNDPFSLPFLHRFYYQSLSAHR